MHAGRTSRRGGKGGFNGLKPIRVKLWSTANQQVSSAATALSALSSITLTTGNFPELASFIQVYDEMRVLRFKYHYFPWVSVGPNAAPFGGVAFATNIQFDPTASAPSSVTAALEESFSHGPLIIFQGGGGTSAEYAFPNSNYRTITATAPKLAPISGADCPGSAWFSLDTATATTLCCIGSYGQALGTAGVLTNSYMVELDIELRLRT